MKRCAFITPRVMRVHHPGGDDVPPAACVQQPAGELRLPAASVGRHQDLASIGAESLREYGLAS
jgi:hypothetical protein